MSAGLAVPATGRFELRRQLGAGGFGTVYEAFDRKRNAIVAVKLLRNASASDLYRFKQEFRVVSGIAHRNLVTLYELVSEGDQWLFSMELVDGEHFLSYVRGAGGSSRAARRTAPDHTRPDRPVTDSRDRLFEEADGPPSLPPASAMAATGPDLVRLVNALRQLADGLVAMHAAGIVHRDIKPANVLCTSEGRLVLLDFGISQETTAARGQSTVTVIGTPDYMSPEQASEQRITPASDWYSVGVLLYEALTGTLPFAGTTLQILRQKTSQEAAAPSSVWAEVPPALDWMCRRLLLRDPEQRPTGEEVLATLRELQAELGSPVEEELHDGREERRKVPFIGREQQLAELNAAFEESLNGKTVVALVRGGSGAGKSTLCQRFLRQLVEEHDKVALLMGRCFEHEDVPFKALDGVIDALSRFLQRRDPKDAAALLPRDMHALARLFPVLSQASAVQAVPQRFIADNHQVRQAAFGALRELFLRLSDRRPVVLYIDDLQWGDLDGIALLMEVLRPPDPPPLLLIVNYRSEEERSSPALQALMRGLLGEAGRAVTLHDVSVSELSPEESTALVRALLPVEAQSRAAAIAADAAGNPFFLTELGRSIAAGMITVDAGGDGLVGQRLDAAIRARVAQLPAASRQLLATIAVAGQPLARATASLAAYGEAGDSDEPHTLALLRSERLIRVRHASSGQAGTESEELLPYHDRVREAVVAGLAPDALATQHLRLAQALVAAGGTEPERLVFHFERGGDAASAARHAIEASALAYQALAYHRTIRLSRQALTSDLLTPAERKIIEVRLAEALAGAGRPKEAADQFLALAEREDSETVLEYRRRAVMALFGGGYVDEGTAVLRQLLAAARLNFPRTRLGLFLILARYMLLVLLRGYRFRERTEVELSREDLLQVDTCESIGHGVTADTLLACAFLTRQIWHALKLGEPVRIAKGLSSHALILHSIGGPPARVARAQATAMALAERLGNPEVLGNALHTSGHIAHMDGRWRESSASCVRAAQLMEQECVHVAMPIDFARTIHVYNLRWMGALRDLSEQLPPLLNNAIENGKQSLEVVLRSNSGFMLFLRDDDPVRAEAWVRAGEARIELQGFNTQHFFVLDARLMVLLYAGRGQEAWRLVDEKQTALRRSGQLRVKFFATVWGNLRAIVGLASGQKLAEVEREANRLAGSRLRFATSLAMLIRALVRHRQGRSTEAVTLMGQAADQLSACDMHLHAAVARLRLGEWMGGEAGEKHRREALGWMEAQEIRNPARMADMLAPV